ncbi:MAG: metal ABC transporter ATP-binding protein [Fimbriimonadales bacterium]|nr:metal ABC transporter ATP-binding protein [Fimbriimonadales bacterium]
MPLEIRNLTVVYNGKPAIHNITLTVREGVLTGIVGPNGAGKSTLLKAVLGLVPRASGEVWLDGRPLDKPRGEIAYVPQRGSVEWDFPVNVRDVVLMGTYARLPLGRRPGRAEREWAMECLRQVGLEDLWQRQIGELSGGQQQRVFLARALAQNAPVYLLDEPLAGVDAATESVIIEQLHRLRDGGRIVLMVHHDLQTVRDCFDEVVLLNEHLIAAGRVDAVMTRENLQRAYGGKLVFLQDMD